MQAIERDRGPVLYTLVDQELREALREHCRRLQLPCVGVLDQAMSVLSIHFHSKTQQWPGRQHLLDDDYFDRIDAMHYTLAHDDGLSTARSRGCRRGPGRSVAHLQNPDLRLSRQSRRARGQCPAGARRAAAAELDVRAAADSGADHRSGTAGADPGESPAPAAEDTESEYTDMERVQGEIQDARRLYARRKWATIDVTRRSIEETSAAILQMLAIRREQRLKILKESSNAEQETKSTS